MCNVLFNIYAKSAKMCAIIVLRKNERVSNLRALVAMRFEHPIAKVVLVFAGRVLSDPEAIDYCGITSGVTVHVVLRKPPVEPLAVSPAKPGPKGGQPKSAAKGPRSAALYKVLMDDPQLVRHMLENNSPFSAMFRDHQAVRHYLTSDSNIREVVSTSFNQAKVDEVRRRCDLALLHMETLGGGQQKLLELNTYLQDAYELSVAMPYQSARGKDRGSADNPQRGYENNLPLPNPWLLAPTPNAQRRSWSLTSHRSSRCRSVRTSRKLSLQPSMEALPIPLAWEHRFQGQLLVLAGLGYTDRTSNLYALWMSGGRVEAAVELLQKWMQQNAPDKLSHH